MVRLCIITAMCGSQKLSVCTEHGDNGNFGARQEYQMRGVNSEHSDPVLNGMPKGPAFIPLCTNAGSG